MASSSLPLFPSDDGWPYPDTADGGMAFGVTAEPDLDQLELRLDPHAFAGLTELERAALFAHFGLDDREPVAMKHLGPYLGCSREEARVALGSAIDKLRGRLAAD